MEVITKSIPFGSIPYEEIDAAARMIAKLFPDNPYLPVIPKIAPEETILSRTLNNIPGIRVKNEKLILKTGSKHYKNDLVKLDTTFNNPDPALLDAYSIESVFLEKFFQLIKKFKSPNATVNLTGPFTISQMLTNAAEEQLLADKSYRKLFIQAVCVKAMWIIRKIKECSPTTVPIIVLEEPYLCRIGDLKRENGDTTVDLITAMLAKVVEKIKSEGALVAIHSKDKCDWQIPINAGIDIISFDAYNNPNNLCIFPESVIEFLKKGGKINWGIIPTMTESIVKALNAEYVLNRLVATMQGLIVSGVPENLVYNSALVSNQGNVDHLPIIFAEKTLILTSQVSKKIPSRN